MVVLHTTSSMDGATNRTEGRLTSALGSRLWMITWPNSKKKKIEQHADALWISLAWSLEGKGGQLKKVLCVFSMTSMCTGSSKNQVSQNIKSI